MNEEQRHLSTLLNDAVNRVYVEERFLLSFSDGDRGGLEQAFVFRTGIHLCGKLIDTPYAMLELDSEYNKNHGNAKTSRRFPHGLRPDLILHQRDSNDKNMLVVEFKGWWNTDVENDIKKLEDLTDDEDNYSYVLGVLVIIGPEKARFRYFINGNEYEYE